LPDNFAVTVSYEHLLALKMNGETHCWPEGAKKKYAVRDLLDGVMALSEREQDQERSSITHHHHYHGDVNMSQGPQNWNNSGQIVGSTLNWGTIRGRVANVVKQLHPPPSPAGPDLRAVLDAFLAALQEACEQAQLTGDDPKDATEAVEEIAVAAKEPGEPKMLEKANKAVRGLGRIVGGVAPLGSQMAALKTAVEGWFAR
jgi:hypothetical protein